MKSSIFLSHTRSLCVALALGIACSPAGLAAQEQDAEPAEISEENPSAEAAEETEGLFGSTETQTILPAEMTADQIIQFFTQFSAQDSIEDALSPLMDMMMTPGDPVDGWSESGIDILAEIDAMEGGSGRNMLRDTGTEVLLAFDLSGAVSPDLSGFHSYALRPEPVGLVEERAYISFGKGLWFETAHQRRKVGNALCYYGYAGVTLHTRRPHTEWSEDELLTTAALFALVDRTAAREVCLVFKRAEDGQYMARAFLPDGRELPALNDDMESSEVMLTSELAEFMKRDPTGFGAEEPAP